MCIVNRRYFYFYQKPQIDKSSHTKEIYAAFTGQYDYLSGASKQAPRLQSEAGYQFA